MKEAVIYRDAPAFLKFHKDINCQLNVLPAMPVQIHIGRGRNFTFHMFFLPKAFFGPLMR